MELFGKDTDMFWFDEQSDIDSISLHSFSDFDVSSSKSLSFGSSSDRSKSYNSGGKLVGKVKTKKTRPYKKRSRVYIPKLVKRDIRNLYSTMLVNVLNYQDYNLWAGYFDTFFRKDLEFSEEFNMIHPDAPKSCSINGADMCREFIFNRIISCPDLVMQLCDTKIGLQSVSTDRGGEESIVVSNFSMEGTKVRDIAPHKLIFTLNNMKCDSNSNHTDKSRPNDCMFLVDYLSQSGVKGQLCGYSAAQFAEILENSPVLAEPLPMKMEGRFTMYLDKNKMLKKFTFNYLIIESPCKGEHFSQYVASIYDNTHVDK